jgi:hypothetical protein
VIDHQLIAQLQTQITAMGRHVANLVTVLNANKERMEMLSRMLSMHHFALLAIVEATPPNDELRDKIKAIAKRFKIKLLPTDPEYTDLQ